MAPSDKDSALKILVIDENPVRRAIIEEGLKDAGFSAVTVLSNTTRLVDHIYTLDPDVILIDLENPSRDVLEQMFQVSRVVRRPIAMFVDKSDKSDIEAAIEAGVSAYIVDGLRLYRAVYVSDRLLAVQLSPAERRLLFDHDLVGREDARAAVARYEREIVS